MTKGEKISAAKTTHGMSKTTEYKSWLRMRERCYKKNNINYKNYGGRGIKVCDRWSGSNNFPNFIKDMGNKPTKKHSIDRKDVNKDYTPENCRWATSLTQARNTRSNVKYKGKCMKEWAEELNVEYSAFAWRVKKYGWNNAFTYIDGSW